MRRSDLTIQKYTQYYAIGVEKFNQSLGAIDDTVTRGGKIVSNAY